jgi:Glycosyl hydrolase catalytic core
MASHASKRGICVPWNFSPDHFSLYQPAFASGKLSWISNWEMWKPQGLPADIHYVPQCRTANEADQIHNYLTGYQHDECVDDCFMGFNEPDIQDQANLNVTDAAKLWKTHVLTMREKCPNVRIGSPAASNAGPPKGLQWLDDFFKATGGIENSGVDFVVLHYYSPDVEHLKQHLIDAYHRFNKPIWLTEFSCTNWDTASPPSETQVTAFMTEALKFLDEAPFIERYSWFGAMEDVGEGVGRANGLQDGGKLSAAGQLYTTL